MLKDILRQGIIKQFPALGCNNKKGQENANGWRIEEWKKYWVKILIN